MATMIPLDPAITATCGSVELRATEAGRTAQGVAASVFAINGRLLAGRTVRLLQAPDRERFAAEVSAQGGGRMSDLAQALLGLAAGVEGALREAGAGRGRSARPGAGTTNGDDVKPAPESVADLDRPWLSADGTYGMADGQTFRLVRDRRSDQDYRIALANFAARIVEETVVDDGAEPRRFFTVTGRLATGATLPDVRIGVEHFAGMAWTYGAWGAGPSIAAGHGTRDHLRVAIERASGPAVPRREVFAHLGWRTTSRGLVYLHAGGAIGGEGVAVDVDQDLHGFELPPPPVDVTVAMRASLACLDVAEPRVAFPLWAAMFRAPLCEWLPFPVVLWALGETGSFKSALTALFASHFGTFEYDHLPASFLDTDNRLEQRAFLVKDAPLIVDDFNPEKHVGLAQEMNRRASRLLRAVGNQQGRGRLRRDLSARPTYVPRGIVIATGEQLPNVGGSAIARVMPIPFAKGSVVRDVLTARQREAPLLAAAMSGYLDFLRANVESFQPHLRAWFEVRRTEAQIEGHARLAAGVAHLQIGLEVGLAYALNLGVITNERATALAAEGWRVFSDLARGHATTMTQERPIAVFLRVLGEALASGHAWLADRRSGAVCSGVRAIGTEKLGWADADGIYLLPETAHRVASEHLRHVGGLALEPRALRRMLAEDGVMRQRDEGRYDKKVRCERAATRVLCLQPTALGDLPPPSDTVGISARGPQR